MLRTFLTGILITIFAVQAKAWGWDWGWGWGPDKPTCGATASSKKIELQTPTNPPRECVYHINAYSKYVCQLRIDFAMTLAQPTLPTAKNGLRNAQCIDDYFEVAGQRLCGTEILQHVYIPFNRTAGVKNIDLRIVLAARVGSSPLPKPSWNMQVKQLECPAGASVRSVSDQDGFHVAPTGCLQYYPQSIGAFTSFNFNKGLGIYPGDLNYAICFRRTEQTKGLELRSHVFKLGAISGTRDGLALDNVCYPQQRNKNITEDFLMIPQATIEPNGLRATYFCGNITTDAVIRSVHPGPLMVIFNSSGVYKQKETGFAFSFQLF